jgi:hypothetical protein
MADKVIISALKMLEIDIKDFLKELKSDGVLKERLIQKYAKLFIDFSTWAKSKEPSIIDFSKRVYFYLPLTEAVYRKLQDEWSLYSAGVLSC